MTHTLASLATRLKGTVIGDGATPIHGMGGLDDVQAGQLTFVEDAKRLPQALASPAAAVIVPLGLDDLAGRSGIQVSSPKLAFAHLLELFHPEPAPTGQVHPTAVVGKDVRLGERVSIGPHAVLGEQVSVGRGTVIGAGAYVGDGVTIGDHCVLDPNVTIYRRTVIGRRVQIHGGSVVGGDGFGYVFDQGRYVKVPQTGNVIIEDDVELGCNVCVDRATVGSTLIQQGTKIDNLVQIAHNDRIGRHVVIAGQAGLSGSVTVGDYVMMGGKAGLVDHLTVGPQAQIGAGSVVTKSIGPRQNVWGFPARPVQETKRQMASAARLPGLFKTVADLLKRLAAVEQRLDRLTRTDGSSGDP
ncbi:MAG: UDP-3-O-(3-hydroxymyristoyl)glucosamine N-acyltransferase [Candidatus Omnitrophica bacterium]|nr:UDP-3-O-(3-hydroxymyristoyl)glucosamine N-acyltransferase [Candidatus Omnitrophota bacterium]